MLLWPHSMSCLPMLSSSRRTEQRCALRLGVAAWAGVALAAAAAATALSAAAYPAAADLVYRTTATANLAGLPMTLHARTTTRWRYTDAGYEAALHTDTIGFDQFSQGVRTASGELAPLRYSEKRPFHDPDQVDIDWANARVRFGLAAPVAAPPAGAQDRLSLQFEMAALYQRAPERFAAGKVFEVELIGTHAVDPWKFLSSGQESVETGRGPEAAIHLAARRTVGATTETMDLWLGLQTHGLPVRIRMVDRNQAVIDSVLQSADFAPPAGQSP